jgi:hypothetical protein
VAQKSPRHVHYFLWVTVKVSCEQEMDNSNAVASEETTLYVLELRHGKFYVGSTNNLDRWFAELMSLAAGPNGLAATRQ